MIEIKDTGIIISSKAFQEKFLIVKCFSKNNGIISGLIRSNKKRNDAISGNIVLFYWRARLNEQLGYLKFEVLNSIFPKVMLESRKIAILNATICMLKTTLKEREKNKPIFLETQNLLHKICINKDIESDYVYYILFEAKLLNSCGYGLNWSRCAVTNSTENIKYISPKTGNAVTEEVGKKYKHKLFELPKFLSDSSINACIKDIILALNLIGYFIEKHLFLPYNTKLPRIRKLLVENLKNSTT